MDTQPQKTDHSPAADSLVRNSVLERLARDGVTPRPWWQFYVREGVVWGCWLLSVVVGAVAVAVTLYVTLSVPYMLYEAMHTNFLTAAVQALPWLWLIVFLAMAYLAWVNLRHTRRGYRYQALTLVASSVVLSVGLGVVLHQFGHGYAMDQTLAAWMTTYPSHEKGRLAVWQAPQEGRLVGTVMADRGQIVIDHATGTIVFQDNAGEQWRLLVSELPSRGHTLLEGLEGGRLRLIGTSTAPHEFYVCGAFHWVFASEYDAYSEQQEKERVAFVETATLHQVPVAAASTTHCASLPVFERWRSAAQ